MAFFTGGPSAKKLKQKAIDSQSLSGDPNRKFLGQDIGSQISMDFREGAQFGRELIPADSLGRLGDVSDLQTVLQGRRELAQGMSGAEFQARRDQASQEINQQTELARRQLAGAQGRAGVRGAAAGSQLAQIIGQGQQQQRQLQQNLLIADREARTQGLSGLENTARSIADFDIGQAAAERFTELQTGLSFGQLGAAERGAVLQANAATEAARLAKPRGGGLLGGGGILGTGIGGGK